MKQPTLRPSDIVIACQLTLSPLAQFASLATSTGISAGECHNAVRRLRQARLILADERRPATEVLRLFLEQGAPFAFPAVVGPPAVGIATGHVSEPFRGAIHASDGFVWPHADGTARGQSLTPLFPGATGLPDRNAPLYELLTIIDALRTGTTRVRKIAAELLAMRFGDTK